MSGYGFGLLLREPSSDALHEAMLETIEQRDRLNARRAAAQAEAKRYSFAAYREGIAALLDDLLKA